MPYNFKYMPVCRSRQQELLVLNRFPFGSRIVPMLEIIKEKDRINNAKSPQEIWSENINKINSERVIVDLPSYIKDSAAMPDEIIAFNRTVLNNIGNRINFYLSLAQTGPKMIPVVSSLLLKTGEANTITKQVAAIRESFPSLAIRTFTNTLELDLPEIKANFGENDILIYDLDTVQPYNPLVRKQTAILSTIPAVYKVALRSAINTEIQNTKLDHADIVADADNSLLEVFKDKLKTDAFGDYAGIKKDDLSAGGTISPGFIFYDPVENLYYGYKGAIKDLSEFEMTIVPAVLNSAVVATLKGAHPDFVNADNYGFKLLEDIRAGIEKGKSQAKFKRISMEHYLHCMKVRVERGDFD
jgi:hypothetical protein